MDNYDNPRPGKTYISPSLKSFGDSERRVRIASKVLESPISYAFGTIKAETVLRQATDAKTHIRATFFEDDRSVRVLNIQGYSLATDKPHNASFSFVGDEIEKLLEFATNIRSVSFEDRSSVNIKDEELRRIALSNRQAQDLVKDNEELFSEVLRSAITKRDVVAVGYRKKQLETFRRLLKEDDFFDRIKQRKNCSDEAVWQDFFEKNPWIFGYGLSYLYLSSLDEKKLEQVVSGYSVAGAGKRVDALMKSKGIIASLCFIEIKTHRTALLSTRPYRVGCWPVSAELGGAVAQVQGTVSAATDTIRNKLSITNSDGAPTGDEAFNYQPKAYLIAGSLSEMVGLHGVNRDMFRSLELFRKNLFSPELITFDELFERAKFIVESAG